MDENLKKYKSMKIVHKHNGKIKWIDFREWRYEILLKHLAINYKILTYPPLVDLIKIDTKTGKQIYVETGDRNYLTDKYLSKSNEYTIKELTDEEIISICTNPNHPKLKAKEVNQSFGFLKTQYRKRIKPIINPIKKLKPIWKFIIAIITMGLGSLLGYIITEWYKSRS